MNRITKLATVLSIFGAAALSIAAKEPAPEPRAQAPADQQGATALSKQDTDFIDDAAQGGLLEARLGQLAAKQGMSEEVRKYGQRMVDDHGRLNQQLAQIAGAKKITVPTVLDKKHQEVVDKLAQYTGAKFDREYMSRMVDEHQSDVKAFEKEAKEGKDPDVKQFAASSLPLLLDHLNQAKEIEARVKK